MVESRLPPADRIQFAHDTLAQRVLFGSGLAAQNVSDELHRLGSSRAMVVASAPKREIAERVAARAKIGCWFDDVVEHVPVELAVRARSVAAEAKVDALISVGGGSTTGLAKAVALTTGLPIVAVPTTYAGSEATDVWGLTEARRKTTGVDNKVLPVSVVYDAELTLTLPRGISLASGLNAMAHCVDSLWAPAADPINRTLALEGARILNSSLRTIAADPNDLSGREQAQYGTYLASVAFSSAGSGMHHKVCHVLGGTFNLPHAPTHAVVLPHVLAFNAQTAQPAVGRLADALDSDDAVRGLHDLLNAVDAPRSLRDLGLTESSLDEAVDLVMPAIPPSNPRPVDRTALADLLRAAWAGDVPDGVPR